MHHVTTRVASAAVSAYEFVLRIVTSSERPPSFVLLELSPGSGVQSTLRCFVVLKTAAVGIAYRCRNNYDVIRVLDVVLLPCMQVLERYEEREDIDPTRDL